MKQRGGVRNPSSIGSHDHAVCFRRILPPSLGVSPSSTEEELRAEAETLFRRAQELRASLPTTTTTATTTRIIEDDNKSVNDRTARTTTTKHSPWQCITSEKGVGYRLQLDIGREEGTWMDPRWGASGRRIPLTLDVLFSNRLATKALTEPMIQDNFGGSSSHVLILETATVARLRNGFDTMTCRQGAYRVDSSSAGTNNVKKQQTVRLYVSVDGTPEKGSYGDVSIPKGELYFSIPCFGSVSNLSTKEGIVTARQMGWHTGWRREESRIIGTVLATPIEKAIARDKF